MWPEATKWIILLGKIGALEVAGSGVRAWDRSTGR